MPDQSLPSDQRPNDGHPRPVILCILDGWGDREDGDDNAIFHANTPNWDRFVTQYPRAQLAASENDVGLPHGQMGNSEVGHMNLGAGRVVMQDLPLIDQAVSDGSLESNPALVDFTAALKESGGTCHLMGLLSPGGVHSHQDHIASLANAVAKTGVPVRIHGFLDGRDTPPSSAKDYAAKLINDIDDAADCRIATIGGRYYAMDRDNRWERNTLAYHAMVTADGENAADPISAIEQSYAAGTTDEFVLPTVIGDYTGMTDGDGILMANFRSDRVRQILTALVDPAFDGFERKRVVKFAARLGMAEYSDSLNEFVATLFPQRPLDNILGQIVSEAGLTQLRIAETEKYAHVTFFFNGGEEKIFPGEERILVPSPKVATYDLQPEMSAAEVTDKLIAAIKADSFDLVIVNFANGDMVGHTGILEAAMAAAETIDTCLGRLETALLAAGGTMLITADHGNLERMRDSETQQPHTAHTLSLVPLILVNPPAYAEGIENGALADVAPTVLRLLSLAQPADMTGRSLIRESAVSHASA
ncbi:MAG: 2,3-bisphosphoglycerate-independent phosphoglycerate mutase [Proteobacteria bacterium]|nr:2,3-bisphosphoglycerate-independent phosphoglycerate mutase [Pseudomonadota bacterium]